MILLVTSKEKVCLFSIYYIMDSLENLTINDRYYIIKKIGEGSFGQVYVAIDLITENYLAIKCEKESD